MKKLIFSVLFSFLSIITWCQNAEQLKIDKGFENYLFGSKASDYSNISFIESIDTDKVYRINDYKKEAFGVPSYYIHLIFTKGEGLYQIEFSYLNADESVFKKIKETLEKRYGPSKKLVLKISGEKESFYWDYEQYGCYIKFYPNNRVSIVMNYLDF